MLTHTQELLLMCLRRLVTLSLKTWQGKDAKSLVDQKLENLSDTGVIVEAFFD